MPSWLQGKLGLREAGEPAETIGERLVRDMNRVPLREREEALQILRRATPGGGKCSDPPLVSWDELREIRRAGMLVGAHTVSRPCRDAPGHPAAEQALE